MTDTQYATYEDLEARWHPLLEAEQEQAEELLKDASEIIRAKISRYPITHEADWEEAHARALTLVCCQMVRTAMEQQVAGSPTGVSQMSQTTGSFTDSYTFASPDGYLRLGPDMLKTLGLGGQIAGSYDFAEAHHGPARL